MKYSLDERVEKARALRKEGYNCSQCVIKAFDDMVSPAQLDTLSHAAHGFGSGYGGRGYVCGAVSGMTMLLGLARDLERPALYREVGNVIDSFTDLEGSCMCGELKKPGRKPCIDLITDAVTILHRRLADV